MGQALHGSARTTAAVRRAIQESQASLNRLVGQYGINPKTVAKWRKRASVEDARVGPEPRSTVLAEEQEAAVAVAVPYAIHTVLTDNGTHFVDNTPEPVLTEEETGTVPALFFRVHAFAYACEQNSIEHRRTRPKHPWANGQVERMNRTLKEATVKRFHHQTRQQLKEHMQAFLMIYNFAKRLKALRGLTPHQFIVSV